jgi:uncharacterized protein DUF2242
MRQNIWHAVAAMMVLAGCGTKEMYRQEPFRADTPFSTQVQGSGDSVCWAVKRAFLTQGYMLDRSGDSAVLSGSKQSQPEDETNYTLRLQTTCTDNKDGTSTVFATASQEISKLQRVRQSVTAGVSIATVTVPAGSEKVFQVVKRETIQDPTFYRRFYALVANFAREDQGARSRTEAQAR